MRETRTFFWELHEGNLAARCLVTSATIPLRYAAVSCASALHRPQRFDFA